MNTNSKPFTKITTAFALALSIGGASQAIADQRTPILVSAAEQDALLGEMRSFLEAVQTITEALAENDMATVAETAKTMGMRAAKGVPAPLMKKLPMDFRKMGMVTHIAFDELAQSVEVADNPLEVVAELGDLMLNCTACHATYRFGIEDDS